MDLKLEIKDSPPTIQDNESDEKMSYLIDISPNIYKWQAQWKIFLAQRKMQIILIMRHHYPF